MSPGCVAAHSDQCAVSIDQIHADLPIVCCQKGSVCRVDTAVKYCAHLLFSVPVSLLHVRAGWAQQCIHNSTAVVNTFCTPFRPAKATCHWL